MASEPERIADGVWRMTGDIKGGMNVFFLADGGGVTMYDAGTAPMTKAVARAAEKLGGLKRIVLGHSHTDHRGTAPGLDAPVYCHPDEVADAEREQWMLDYWDLDKLEVWWSRRVYPFLHRRWDAGAVEVAGTVSEGDEVCGFEVLHFPGHARGLIGLWKQSEGLAIVSDTVYFVDSVRLKEKEELDTDGVEGHEGTVPHPAFNMDTAKARESVRRLAGLRPKTVWAGHDTCLSGDPGKVATELERAAARKFPDRARDTSA